jgi:hypothetical protein
MARETRGEANASSAGRGSTPTGLGGNGADLGARAGEAKLASSLFGGGVGLDGDGALKLGAGAGGRGGVASPGIGRAKGGGFAATGRSARCWAGARKGFCAGTAGRPESGPFDNPFDACDFRRIASATARSNGEDCGGDGGGGRSKAGRVGVWVPPAPGAVGRPSPGGVLDVGDGRAAAGEVGEP